MIFTAKEKKNTSSCNIFKFNVYRAHTAFQNLENVPRNVRQRKCPEIRIFLFKFSNCYISFNTGPINNKR